MAVASDSRDPPSGCNNQKEERRGKKEEQSNREYSSKVLASKELYYICMEICVKGHIGGLNCRMPE